MRPHFTTSLLLCLALAWHAPATFAQSDASDPADEAGETLEPVLVTGLRIETPIDQLDRSVSVITAEEIKLRQQRFVYDTLAIVPGVQVIRSGSFGGLSSVSIRGLPSDQTLVVVDGVISNNPAFFGNSFDFANFDANDIERVEVLRGAQSTLFGADAIGGVINIITRGGEEGLGGSAFFEGGSFGTYRGSASLRGGTKRYSGRVTISGVSTEGFSAADSDDGNVEDDGYRNFTASTKLRAEPIDNLEFIGTARYSDSESEFDGFAPPTFALGDTGDTGNVEDLMLSGFARHKAFDGKWVNEVLVAYFDSDLLNEDGTGFATFDAEGERATYEYQTFITPIEQVTLVAGFEFETEDSGIDAGQGESINADTISYFALLRVTPLPYLSLNGGVRVDNNTNFGAETTFTGSGALQVPGTGFTLRGSYSEGFQAPTAGEQNFNDEQSDDIVLSPGQDLQLEPEESTGWEVGVDFTAFNDRLLLQATWFDQEIEKLLTFQFVPGAPNFGIFTNVDKFETEGLELSGRLRLIDGLDLSASYTYVDAINLTTDIVAGNQPDHRFSMEAAWQASDKLSLSAAVTYNGSEKSGVTILDDFTLVTLRGAYALNEHVEIFARVENAIDENYQDNAGFGTAPASGFAGLRLSF